MNFLAFSIVFGRCITNFVISFIFFQNFVCSLKKTCPKQKFTASSQLKYDVVEHFDSRTIEKKYFLNIIEKYKDLSDVGSEFLTFNYVVHFGIISR